VKLDVLVVAAHPDDAEISTGGTILRLVRAGKKVGVVDLTRGEMGTRGTAADRARETAAANAILKLALRENLDLGDGRVQVTLEARERLAALMRELQPEIVLAQHTDDLHPDHKACGELARAAWYLAGLTRLSNPSATKAARRPQRIYYYMGHVPFEPTFVVDIGPVWEEKLELVRCYASQLTPQGEADRGQHFLFGADILSRMETRARTWGERIGVRYGEPFLHKGPLPCLDPLLCGG